ncbi:MAG: hypothetical protein DRI61_05455 [Chloroflexi bacterium]|nr:MAG: hypothetical protein DRI61_05455 [Chloroflexota bacterium]
MSPLLPFNPLDGLIILALGIGAIWGFTQGFFRQLTGVGCLYAAAVISAVVFQEPSWWLSRHLYFPRWMMDIAVFLVILVALYALFMYLVRDTYKAGEAHFPGAINRVGGMVAGFALALLWLSILLMLFEYALGVHWLRWDHLRQAIADNFRTSQLAPLIMYIGHLIIYTVKPLFPRGLPNMLKPGRLF